MRSDIVKGGYNKMARAYMAERDKLKSGKYVQKLLKLLPKKSTILDVGCGAGIPVDDLLLDAGHMLVGIDISKEMVEMAKRNCPSGEYIVADMLDLKNGEHNVTAIVSFYALFHIPREKQEKLIKTLVGYVAPGGYLLLTMGDRDFEGEHILFGENMWSSQWGASWNRAMIERLGLEILLDEIDRSGGEAHQVFLLQK